MVKKFSLPCDFAGGQSSPVDFFIGKPMQDKHPLEFQSKWLSSNKDGQVPSNIMNSISLIQKLAHDNNVPFEDLCLYAINLANDPNTEENHEFNKLLASLDQ
jgi:hypothetical protein